MNERWMVEVRKRGERREEEEERRKKGRRG